MNSCNIPRLLIFITSLLSLVPSTTAQNNFLPPALKQRVALQGGGRRIQSSPQEQQLERDRVRALNKERQEKLKEDTDRLLQLATELKQYVDKTNENILSINVVKKTDEIEKLAKSIRDKMKTAYVVPQDLGTSPR